MSYNLNIRAFFFNAKTDYLPYYKHFNITVDADVTIKEVLAKVQEQNFNFYYPKQKLIMKINGLVVEGKEPITNLVEKLGTELTIEPVKSYRSNNGLKINDDDFMQSYALLEPYATESDLTYYKTLYALHYASETENFEHSYIGDAILVLAHKMIGEGNEHKEEILKTITSVNSGLLDCEYENNLFNAQSHDTTITELKKMLNTTESDHPSLLALIKKRFLREKEEKIVLETQRASKHIEDLSEKSIAYYPGTTVNNEETIVKSIRSLKVREISMSRKNKLSGLSILKDNRTLALQKAGATLLDAYDAGAEVLIVENESCYDMFEKHFSEIENVIGRKMRGLELILASDFLAQINTVTA